MHLRLRTFEDGGTPTTIVLALALLALLGVGLWKGPDGVRGFQHNRFLKQAEALVQSRDYTNAAFVLRKALLKRPTSLPATRLMADVSEHLGNAAQTAAWRAKLVELEPTNRTHLVQWTRAALQSGDLAAAGTALEAWQQRDPGDAEFHKLSAAWAVARQDPSTAEQHLVEAARLEPENPKVRLNLAVVRMVHPESEVRAEARVVLTELVEDPTVGREALRHRIGAALQEEDYAGAVLYSTRLLAQDDVPVQDRVLRLTALRSAGDGSWSNLLGQVKTAAATNAEDAVVVARWMLAGGLAGEALEWVGSLEETVRAHPPLPLLLVELYAAQQDYPSMIAHLEGGDWVGQNHVRLALLAKAHRQAGQRTAADAAWRRALQQASSAPSDLTALAQLTARWGWSEETRQTLLNLYQRSPRDRWVKQELTRLYYAEGQTLALNRLLARILESDPTNAAVKNNLAMTSLLLNPKDPQAHQLAREAYEAQRDNPHFVSTYAFALRQQARPEDALHLLEDIDPTELQDPTIAAYYGIVLAELGQKEKAAPFLEAAAQAQLLPEEQRLVAQARGL